MENQPASSDPNNQRQYQSLPDGAGKPAGRSISFTMSAWKNTAALNTLFPAGLISPSTAIRRKLHHLAIKASGIPKTYQIQVCDWRAAGQPLCSGAARPELPTAPPWAEITGRLC